MSASASAAVPPLLEEYGAVVRDALRTYLPSLEPKRYLYDILADYPNRGGRMMRPTLCLATARTFGASLEDALGSAVSIELLHNALLIHDDIEDESDERRGQPTLHHLHGVPLALNAGDALTLTSLRPLIDNLDRLGPGLSLRILREAERMGRETAEGQALELGWRHDNVLDLGDEDYLDMVLRKTCWLATIYPLRVGALIGSRGRADLDGLTHLGFFLGAAFQIQDDLLNLVGDASYGKERDGDLYEGKRTVMLLHLLRHAQSDEAARLRHLFRDSRCTRSAEDVRWMRALMDQYGSIDYAREFAHGLAGAARAEFSLLFGDLPDTPDRQFIEGLVTWVFERS